MAADRPPAERPIKVLFVCTANICRSPTAEAVFRKRVEEAGLVDHVLTRSAATSDYRIGERPDERACSAAAARGYDLSQLRARQVNVNDFADFDYVLAMDEMNMHALRRLCPREHAHKVRLLTHFGSSAACGVPDPYPGGPEGFEHVLDLVEDSTRGLLRHIRRQLNV